MRSNIAGFSSYLALALVAAFGLYACGGGDGSTPAPKVLVSIAITPTAPSVAVGLTEQLHATGTYSDGSTSDLTSAVIINWASATQSVVGINSTGLATGATVGTSVISAYSGAVIGTATLTVTPAPPTSIAISLIPAYSGVGATLQLMVIGTYPDHSMATIASGVTWTSSVSSVASIDSTTGQTTGQSVGVTAITATFGSLVASAPLNIIANAWGTTGSMASGRYGFALTLLSNGLVLAAGGYLDSGIPGPNELFNPATGTWTQTGGNGGPEYDYPTVTLLQNGMVLVAGGLTEGGGDIATDAASLYNPTTDTWSATSSLPNPLFYHTATLLPDGTVLVAGGENGYPNLATANAEIYDPVAGTWRATGNLTVARRNHTATLLPNGKVLVVGGFGSTGSGLSDTTTGPLTSAEIYDPATSTWTAVGSLTTGVASQTASLLSNGKVLVAGGQVAAVYPSANALASATAELYDPTTGNWTRTGSLLTGVFNHTATVLPNGTVLVAGGQGTSESSSATTATEIYDPTTGVWTATGSLMNSRYTAAAVLLPNGTVLDAGGSGTGTSAEIYFFQANPGPHPFRWTVSSLSFRPLIFIQRIPQRSLPSAGGRSSVLGFSSLRLYSDRTYSPKSHDPRGPLGFVSPEYHMFHHRSSITHAARCSSA